MKSIADMSLTELAAWVSNHLGKRDISVVLVGGACVSAYSDNRYQTNDLDFVERYHTNRNHLKAALAEIGFYEENRYFRHSEAAYFLEFPTGPLAIGNSPVGELGQLSTEQGVLILLTPTDCVKDRLCAWYHWNDRQSLRQAVWVAIKHPLDMDVVRQWSEQEGMADKFNVFLLALSDSKTQKND